MISDRTRKRLRRASLRPLTLLLAVMVILGLAAGSGLAMVAHLTVVRPAYGTDGLLTILAIGSDAGPPHRPGNIFAGRADAIHLIAVDPAARRATIVNFPRDSLVAGRKVNAFLALGGPERLRAEVEAFTGVPIDHWALTTFRGIELLTEGLGGIDVVVDTDMRDPFSGSNFRAGPQTFDGQQALAYVRDRKSVAGGDFGRTRHQGDLLRFAHAQVRARQSSLSELVRLVALFARTTSSSIPEQQLLPMAVLAVDIDPAAVRQVALSGSVGVGRGGASVVRLNVGDTFDRIRAGVVGP